MSFLLQRCDAMRLIETLLSFTNLLAFFAMAISLPRSLLWSRYLAPIALLIAIAQVLAEGYRYQMVPAYMLSDLFFLVWLLLDIVFEKFEVACLKPESFRLSIV